MQNRSPRISLAGAEDYGTAGSRAVTIADLLFSCLESAFYLDSAAHVVDYLRRFAQIQSVDIARAILDRLMTSKTEDEQNRLSYGLWSLFDWSMASTGTAARDLRERIAGILKEQRLGAYARSTLEECLANITSDNA